MRYSRVFSLRRNFMPSALMKGIHPNCHNYRVLPTLAADSGGAVGIKSCLYVTHTQLIRRQCFKQTTLMRRSTPNWHNYRVLPTLAAGSGGVVGIKSRLYATHTQRDCFKQTILVRKSALLLPYLQGAPRPNLLLLIYHYIQQGNTWSKCLYLWLWGSWYFPREG